MLARTKEREDVEKKNRGIRERGRESGEDIQIFVI